MNETHEPFWSSPKGMVAILAIGFLGYFLFIEHREHVFQFLPYLIILLCPVMHIFMHGGHGHGGQGNHKSHDHHESESEAYRRGLEDGRKGLCGRGVGSPGGVDGHDRIERKRNGYPSNSSQ